MVLAPLQFQLKFRLFVYKIYRLLTKIELYIIEKVKKIRLEKGLSQLALSQKLDMNDSFVSHVESHSKRAKYNLNHLNALAKVFDCSPKDFMPEKSL